LAMKDLYDIRYKLKKEEFTGSDLIYI
jgi:hypothetical protein